ncbi:hypothetical protein [Streptomyces aidingensis]|uniref:hypothetical protein n=1 Tax=Streptomyces aidingensis TaxID=910347 RepID=UPI00111503FD|nr:hypothetical protein [Streptomyces aidingensis]
MDSYEGAATLVADSIPTEVTAVLRVEPGGPFPCWLGHLLGPDADLYDAYGATELRLELPSGRAGRVVPRQHHEGAGRLDVQGSGPAPF